MKCFHAGVMVVLAAVFLSADLYAAPPRSTDQPGSRDHALISRYKGAVIQNYKKIDYGSYVLGTGAPVNRNLRGHGRYFKEFKDIEGEITRTQYIIPKTEGLFKVYKNYETALQDAGLTILHTESHQTSAWPFWTEDLYWGDNGINRLPGDFYKPFGREGFYYLAAQGEYQGRQISLALFINYGSDAGKEFILVTQDIVVSAEMETGLVTAEKMKKAIDANGHIALYGIYFDTGKSAIKPASEKCLQEIAAYMKQADYSLFYIVGHTDSRGSLDGNMKLSARRAEAVADYLTGKLGIDAARLKAAGVGFLAPASSNQTGPGRAKNRRVEIVLP